MEENIQESKDLSADMWLCSACHVKWSATAVVTVSFPGLTVVCVCVCDSSVSLPHTRGQAAEEEGDVALDEGGEEGKHAVDGEGDEEGLPPADPISQAAPHEGADHHPQVHDETWGRKERDGREREDIIMR